MSSDQDCASEVTLLIISTYCATFHTVFMLSHGQELAFFWRAISWDTLSGYSQPVLHSQTDIRFIKPYELILKWGQQDFNTNSKESGHFLFVTLPVIPNITLARLQNPASIGNHQLCWVHRRFCKEGKCTEISVLMVVVCCSVPRSIGNGHGLFLRLSRGRHCQGKII